MPSGGSVYRKTCDATHSCEQRLCTVKTNAHKNMLAIRDARDGYFRRLQRAEGRAEGTASAERCDTFRGCWRQGSTSSALPANSCRIISSTPRPTPPILRVSRENHLSKLLAQEHRSRT